MNYTVAVHIQLADHVPYRGRIAGPVTKKHMRVCFIWRADHGVEASGTQSRVSSSDHRGLPLRAPMRTLLLVGRMPVIGVRLVEWRERAEDKIVPTLKLIDYACEICSEVRFLSAREIIVVWILRSRHLAADGHEPGR